MPKDRDLPINQRPPSERKHQLAPPPGRVSIRSHIKENGSPGSPGSPSQSIASGQSSVVSNKQGKSISGGIVNKTLIADQKEKGTIKPVRPDLARAML